MNKAIFVFLLILSLSLKAQETRTFTFSSENTFMLKEITTIIQEVKQDDDTKILVELIPPISNEKYKNINLQKGDEILFMNGNRVKGVKDLHDTYNSLKTGDEIKLGVKRGKERFFVTLVKEEDTHEGKRTMIMGGDGKQVDMKDGKAIINGKEVNIDSLKKAGKLKLKKEGE